MIKGRLTEQVKFVFAFKNINQSINQLEEIRLAVADLTGQANHYSEKGSQGDGHSW